jgi:hypothetical protein
MVYGDLTFIVRDTKGYGVAYSLPAEIREWFASHGIKTPHFENVLRRDKDEVLIRYKAYCRDEEILLLFKLTFPEYRAFFADNRPKMLDSNGNIVNAPSGRYVQRTKKNSV